MNNYVKTIYVAVLLSCFCAVAESQQLSMTALSVDDAVNAAIAANPQVLSAKAQYLAALHQIYQAYTPQDPQLSYGVGNSPSNLNTWVGAPSGYTGGHYFPFASALGLQNPAVKTLGISESFQFPGESWLQGDQAHRTAEIAKLTYEAAVRDTRAGVETAYYQTLLDSASVEIAAEDAASFAQVMEVARVAYTANQVAESDLISAQFSVSQASQTVWADQVSEANDEASLNQILGRRPQTPLQLTSPMDLTDPFAMSLDTMTARAMTMRQELLEAMLTEKNNKTALTLAWMELLPNFSVSYSRNWYYTFETEPHAGVASDNSGSIGINVPIFFWFHQKEDIQSASNLLEAARQNRSSVELQTQTNVVQLYRSTNLAYQTALLYRNLLVPLADKDFRVALIAYQAKQVDFTTLAGTLQNIYNARLTYLTSLNQFLAGQVALEQLMGGPLK